MKLRLLIVILLVAALFSGVVLWRVDRFLYGDRMAWAEAQARSQVSSMIQAIRVEIQSGRRMLSTVNADTFKPTLTNWKSFQPYYAVALMTSQNGVMGISKMITRSDSPAANWTAVQLGQYIGFMGKELDSRGTVLLRSFKDPKKNTHVAVIYAGGGHAYILVGSGGNLQTLIESQKGSISSFAIVASDGLTISHAVPEYIGTVMGDSTLLKEIRATGSAQGLGTYLQGKKQVFGMYEQVPGSSAYVISTVPMDDLVKGRLSLAWQFVFLAVGFGLIGAAGYVWYEKRNPRGAPAAVSAPARPTQEVLPPIPSVSMQNVVTPPPSMSGRDVITSNASLIAPIAPKSAPPSPGTFTSRGESVPAPAMPPDWQQEKAEAYRQVAAAMGQEMRAPLASILGFSQMVLSKTQEPEVVQAVESILREARSSRDVLEKLVTFSGERRSPKSEAKIEGPLVQALKILDSRIQLKGIQVEKDFQDTRPWLMASEDLVKVFESFIENAIEGMERMQNKILKISTSESEAGLHVRIVDTGEGIERENLGKVFEPFFTTRSYANHVGLGLPVAAGILKEHHAHVKIQSQRGDGTQVDILFPPRDADVAMTLAGGETMSAVELPAELPKVASPSPEEIKVAMKDTERSRDSKLMDVNVDSLLDFPSEDAPLQFLDGMGFSDDDPPPTAQLPKISEPVAPLPPKPVATPPPVMAQSEADPDFEQTRMFVQGPTPIKVPNFEASPVVEPETETVVELKTEIVVEEVVPAEIIPVVVPEPEPAPEPEPSVVIDKPSLKPQVRSSELDSYKVAVKRPGKRT